MRINLLDDDSLRKPGEEAVPEDQKSPGQDLPEEHPLDNFDEAVEQDNPSAAETDEPSVKIPRGEGHEVQGSLKHRQPQQSPVSKGPSLGFIIFLIIIAAGVVIYFWLFRNPKEMTPVPVTPKSEQTTQTPVPSAPPETTKTAAEVPAPPEKPVTPPIKEKSSQATPAVSKADFGRLETNADDIKATIIRGKKKLESSYRILSTVQAQSVLRLLSISDDHLALSGVTRSRTFANRVKVQLTDTAIIHDMPLFDVSPVLNRVGEFEVNVYATLRQKNGEHGASDLKSVGIGTVLEEIKEWIGVPTITIASWQTKHTDQVGDWQRGPLYIQVNGTKTGIIRVIHALKNYSHNVGISKIIVYSQSRSLDSADQYTLNLYLTLFGKENS